MASVDGALVSSGTIHGDLRKTAGALLLEGRWSRAGFALGTSATLKVSGSDETLTVGTACDSALAVASLFLAQVGHVVSVESSTTARCHNVLLGVPGGGRKSVAALAQALFHVGNTDRFLAPLLEHLSTHDKGRGTSFATKDDRTLQAGSLGAWANIARVAPIRIGDALIRRAVATDQRVWKNKSLLACRARRGNGAVAGACLLLAEVLHIGAVESSTAAGGTRIIVGVSIGGRKRITS